MHIKELKALATDFDDAMEAQSDAIADREIGTMERTIIANEIYAEISRICDTGKGIWKDVNEAKYNDYIIYNTPGAKPEEETPEGEDWDWVRQPKADPQYTASVHKCQVKHGLSTPSLVLFIPDCVKKYSRNLCLR